MHTHYEIERPFGEREVAGRVGGRTANHFGQFGWHNQDMECWPTAVRPDDSSARRRRVGAAGHREFLARHFGQQRQENLYDRVEKSHLQHISVRRIGVGAQFMLQHRSNWRLGKCICVRMRRNIFKFRFSSFTCRQPHGIQI